MFGNRCFSAEMIRSASETLSVVCVTYASRSGSGTRSAATSSGDSTTTIDSGASPTVPMASSCFACPMNTIV